MDPTRPAPPFINVHAIDAQHAVLIERIEGLAQAMANGQGAPSLPQIIRDIADYANYHGPAEERLMESFGYPLRDMHAMEHRKFFLWLNEIERMVTEGHSAAALQTLSRLRGWLERHMMEWDGRLGEFLNRSGIA